MKKKTKVGLLCTVGAIGGAVGAVLYARWAYKLGFKDAEKNTDVMNEHVKKYYEQVYERLSKGEIGEEAVEFDDGDGYVLLTYTKERPDWWAPGESGHGTAFMN